MWDAPADANIFGGVLLKQITQDPAEPDEKQPEEHGTPPLPAKRPPPSHRALPERVENALWVSKVLFPKKLSRQWTQISNKIPSTSTDRGIQKWASVNIALAVDLFIGDVQKQQ
jgi:hypothetical protein